jgi:TRAP-type C4-dicarboxylate transport system permease small subunit
MELEKDANIRKSASTFETVLGKITSVCLIAGGMVVFLMAVITTYGATRRYLFHSPDNNAYLFSCVLMVGCVVLSIAHIQFSKRNITVDYVSKYLPRAVRDWVKNVGGPVLGLIFCITLVWKSWDEAWFAMRSGEHTLTLFAIPTYPMRFSVVFGAGLLCLVLVVQMLSFLVPRLRRTNELSKTEEKTVPDI